MRDDTCCGVEEVWRVSSMHLSVATSKQDTGSNGLFLLLIKPFLT